MPKIAYIFIAFAPTLFWSIVASTLLYIGFAFAVPISNSIISVIEYILNIMNRRPIDRKFKVKY